MPISLVLPVPGEHILSCHISSGSSYTCLDLMTGTVLRSAGWVFCRKSLYWGLFDVFLVIRLVLWVLGRKAAEVRCHH